MARQPVQQIVSVAGQERQQAQRTVLQIVIWIERFAKGSLVRRDDAGAQIHGAAGLGAQFAELVEDLPVGGVERSTQRCIKLRDGLAHPRENLAQFAFALRETRV